MGRHAMGIARAVSTRFDMYRHISQFRISMKQGVAHLFCDLMAVTRRQVFVHRNVEFGKQAMPDPACAYHADSLYTRNPSSGMFYSINYLWINGIHEAMIHRN